MTLKFYRVYNLDSISLPMHIIESLEKLTTYPASLLRYSGINDTAVLVTIWHHDSMRYEGTRTCGQGEHFDYSESEYISIADGLKRLGINLVYLPCPHCKRELENVEEDATICPHCKRRIAFSWGDKDDGEYPEPGDVIRLDPDEVKDVSCWKAVHKA